MNSNTIEQIIQLRKEKKSMNFIAELLGISRKTVRYYCAKFGLDGILADNPKVDKALEIFIENIKLNHPNIEYISNFINTGKPVRIKCKVCDFVFERSAQFARKHKKVTCPNCLECRRKPKPTTRKRVELKPIKIRVILLNRSSLKEVKISKCKTCDSVYRSTRNKVYCSIRCANKAHEMKKAIKRRKMEQNGVVDHSITLDKLIKRENKLCYICGDECDSNDFTISSKGHFIVGKNYPSIEHVIPIAKGGTHTWDNVKLAHHHCNSIKSDNFLEPQLSFEFEEVTNAIPNQRAATPIL